MKRVLLLTVSILLLALPAIAAVCASCPVASCTPEAIETAELQSQPAENEQLLPCHAAMQQVAKPEPAPEEAPCSGSKGKDNAALECCVDSVALMSELPSQSIQLPLEALSLASKVSTSKVELPTRLADERIFHPPPEPASSLRARLSIWLI